MTEENKTKLKIQRMSNKEDTACLQASTSSETVNEAMQNSSKQICDGVSLKPDYTVHLASNKTSKAEFNLYIP